MSTRGFVSLAGASLFLLLAAAAPAAAQGRITGTVTDSASGQPLPGVRISIEGTTHGAVTGETGQFQLVGVSPGTYTVAAQRIGYQRRTRQDVAVSADAPVTVDLALPVAVLRLQEITAVGTVDPIAGVRSPFSVGKVSRQDVASVPTTGSAAAAIQGKVAGVQIIRGSGQPGSGVSVLLRTPTAIMTDGLRNNNPMFVVDGVILGSTVDETTVDLESLDIESIEVVKGAAAASLYGSRAASGVISITTSRGNDLGQGRTRITARSEYGQSAAPTNVNLATHHNWQVDANGQYVDQFGEPITSLADRVVAGDDFLDNPYPGQTYDNLNALFKPGRFQTQTFSIASMTAATNFMTSINNFQEEGSLENNNGFVRRNFRVNLDHRLRDDFSVGISAFHSRSKQDDLIGSASEGGAFWDLMMYAPDVNLAQRDANGKYIQVPDPLVLAQNPLWTEANFENLDRRSRTQANVTARWSPLSWLTLQGEGSYDRFDGNDLSYTAKGTPNSVTSTSTSDGSLDLANEYADALNGSVSATAMHNFGDLTTRLTVRGVAEREKNVSMSADGDDFTVIGVPDISAANTRDASSGLTEIKANAFMTQTGLDYAGRYVFDALFRRDGSSLFGPDARWNTYYRVAGAWLLGQEEWWPVEQLGEFKVRYAVGTAGSRPNFSDQYETWNVSGTTGAITKGILGNRELRPAITTEHEAGIDFILLDRYAVELSYIRQETRDQIIQMSLPAHIGYSVQWQNSGTQEGRTLEATIQANIVNRPGFTWSTTLVADRSRSEITEWNRPCFFDGLNNICEGAALDEMWGERFYTSLDELPESLPREEFEVNDDGYVVWVGAGNSWQDGLWGTTTQLGSRTLKWGHAVKELDADGFPVIQQIGSSAPDVQIGWLNNIRWRGFTVHTQFHAQIGGEVYNATRQRLYQHTRHGNLDQFGKPGYAKKTVDYYFTLYNAMENTSEFVEKGSFLKLREVSVQYRLSRSQLARFGAFGALAPEGINLGVNARNLFTITPYSGFDPEVGSVLQRRDYFVYPNTRNFTGFVEITF